MNRLATESSPYLRQHADNPVDWYPWGEEAFERARNEDKPVLLSIGYSACHWCHVMAHESFEDDATAAVMNERFVNVKVDREQRPDVDAIYMDATLAMNGHGGWPMTVFMTPDGKPFFCGTYFPKDRRGRMPSFLDILDAVHDAWQHRRGELTEQAEGLTETMGRTRLLGRRDGNGGGEGPDATRLEPASVLAGAYRQLKTEHDDHWGGFGGAPKFPQAMSLDLLLRAYARNGSPVTIAMVQTSLDAMAAGGIYDHLGGGFARYSVDGIWLVPHFEKMLYDQALLLRAYLHAWQVTGRADYRQVLDETVTYVLRDLTAPEGGFYSAEDADSEGEEGLFYTWTPAEIREVLGDRDLAAAAIDWWGVTDAGNFEGRNILNRITARGQLLRPPDVEEARERLFGARAARVRPGLDDKVLAEWNGLFLAGLAEAAGVTGNEEWRAAAVRNGEFLVRELRRDDGRWRRAWQRDAGAQILGFAADYGALIDGFTRLYEATGEARWITVAVETAEELLELFWDGESPGFFTTGHDGEQLVTRAKDFLDSATPSANSLAAVSLLRLASLTGIDRFADRAQQIVDLLSPTASSHPTALAHLLAAVDLLDGGATEIAVVGDRTDLVRVVQERYLPRAVLVWGERFESPLWHGREDGRAYVCRNYACRAPVSTPEELADQLSG